MQKDFRLFLQEKLVERCKVNPGYSLRAFARSLEVSPAALSDMLNGKRAITEKMKLRLGSAIGLSTAQLEKLKATRDKRKKPYQPQFHQLSLDTFAVISEWYHYAILELTQIEGFRSDTEYISKKLGITKSEANFAIERLLRLGLLKEIDCKWVDASPNNGFITNIESDKTSIASKKMQKQILEKSIEALETVGLEKRSHTSVTMAIDKKDMNKAFELIKIFRRQFNNEMQPDSNPTDVYQLHVGFYPANKEEVRK